MTEVEWYFELNKRALEIFDKLHEYLVQINSDEKKHYFKFKTREENNFEFLIGHYTILLTFEIDLKEVTCNFNTSVLRRNPDNFETKKIEELTLLKFILDSYSELFFFEEKEQDSGFQRDERKFYSKRINDFPREYLFQVKKCFETI